MKQQYAVIVLFALIISSSLTSLGSYRSTSLMVCEDMDRALELSVREEINDKLHGMGFAYVALDLKGYRTGSLNEVLK